MRKLHIWIVIGIIVITAIVIGSILFGRYVRYVRHVYWPTYDTISRIESYHERHMHASCSAEGAKLPAEAPRGLEEQLARARELVAASQQIEADAIVRQEEYLTAAKQAAAERADAIMAMTDSSERFAAIKQFLGYDDYKYLTEEAATQLRTDLDALAVSERERLLTAARTGSKEAFEELWELASYRVKHFSREKFIFPHDWNDLVALHRKSPIIGSFYNIGKPSPGQVVAMAGDTLMDDDLTTAQIILAWAQESEKVWTGSRSEIVFPYRDALKGRLIADLTKLVARRRREEFARRALEASTQMT